MKLFTEVPEGRGECPVCNGTGRVDAADRKYLSCIAGYDKESHTLSCDNCGAQKMYGKSTGLVPLTKEGLPCVHEYIGREAGRCYTKYHCTKCSDSYDIDSGD